MCVCVRDAALLRPECLPKSCVFDTRQHYREACYARACDDRVWSVERRASQFNVTPPPPTHFVQFARVHKGSKIAFAFAFAHATPNCGIIGSSRSCCCSQACKPVATAAAAAASVAHIARTRTRMDAAAPVRQPLPSAHTREIEWALRACAPQRWLCACARVR